MTRSATQKGFTAPAARPLARLPRSCKGKTGQDQTLQARADQWWGASAPSAPAAVEDADAGGLRRSGRGPKPRTPFPGVLHPTLSFTSKRKRDVEAPDASSNATPDEADAERPRKRRTTRQTSNNDAVAPKSSSKAAPKPQKKSKTNSKIKVDSVGTRRSPRLQQKSHSSPGAASEIGQAQAQSPKDIAKRKRVRQAKKAASAHEPTGQTAAPAHSHGDAVAVAPTHSRAPSASGNESDGELESLLVLARAPLATPFVQSSPAAFEEGLATAIDDGDAMLVDLATDDAGQSATCPVSDAFNAAQAQALDNGIAWRKHKWTGRLQAMGCSPERADIFASRYALRQTLDIEQQLAPQRRRLTEQLIAAGCSIGRAVDAAFAVIRSSECAQLERAYLAAVHAANAAQAVEQLTGEGEEDVLMADDSGIFADNVVDAVNPIDEIISRIHGHLKELAVPYPSMRKQ